MQVPSVTVRVDGAARPVESVSVSGEIATELGSRVTGGAGLVGADASITWAQEEAVTSHPRHPWLRAGGWPPVPGAPCTVDFGDGDESERAFTGVLRSTRATISNGSLSSRAVDGFDQLKRPITLDPLLSLMPPLIDGGAERSIGLAHTWITERILDQCGFHAVAPTSEHTVWAQSMMGSTWPSVGTLYRSDVYTFSHSSRGPMASVPNMEGRTDRYVGPAVPWELTVDLPDFGGDAGFSVDLDVTQIDARYGFGLSITDDGTVIAQSVTPTRWNLASIDASGATRVTMRVTQRADGFDAVLRSDDGQEASGSSGFDYGNPQQMRVRVADNGLGGSKIGAVQVSRGAPAWEALHAPRTANIQVPPGWVYSSLRAMPALTGRQALDVLVEQSQAVLTAMWIDEDGIFQWLDPQVLPSRDTAHTLTSYDDLLELTASQEATGPYSKVRVAYQRPRVSWSRVPNITVWQGRREQLDAGQSVEELIHPPADETWVMVDTDVQLAGAPTGGDQAFNRGVGSWIGGHHVDAEGEPTWHWWGDSRLTDGEGSITQIDHRTWLYTLSVLLTAAPGGQVLTETNPVSTGLWQRWHEQGLPLLRAKAKVTWTDADLTVDVGAPSAPEWEHDAGWWVQTELAAQRVADLLAARVLDPQPLLESVEIVPNHQVRLGDRVTINDPDRTGLAIDGIVVRNDRTRTAGDATHELALRVLSATVDGATWGEHAQAWEGALLFEHDAAWFGSSLHDFDDAPLSGAPRTD